MNENESLTLLREMVKSYSPVRHIPANLTVMQSSADLLSHPIRYQCAYCSKLFWPLDTFYDASAHDADCAWAQAFVWLETLEPQR